MSGEALRESAFQTAGPYVHVGLAPRAAGIEGVYAEDLGTRMRLGPVEGREITLRGTVIDGTGAPLRDALIEIWQADARGLHASAHERRGRSDPGFTGWGRCPSDPHTGEFVFETVKPGPVPFVDGRPQAPHVTFWIVARGINVALQTRMYFEDEPEANAADPLLARIDPPSRAATLLARREGEDTYRFDIRLQGEAETVFLDI